MGLRWVVALAIVAAAIGGAAGSAVTLQLRDDYDGRVRGSLVHLGPPDYLAAYTPQPFCVPLHHFCIVQPEPGHPVALYTYDPHPIFREQGCEVRFDPQAEREDNAGVLLRGFFRDPCGGSDYDLSGHRLFGPTPRDLDRFPVQVTNDATIVDTRTLICGNAGPARASGCPRAPVGD